jgi:hypothetical protein
MLCTPNSIQTIKPVHKPALDFSQHEFLSHTMAIAGGLRSTLLNLDEAVTKE